MLTEFQEYWLVTVDECKVIRCCIDYAFSLELQSTNSELVLRLEGEFVVKNKHLELYMASTIPTKLGPALAMLFKQVKLLKLYKCGDLEVAFEHDQSLFVSADEGYEAWELIGTNGLRVVSMPGGKLAIWQNLH